MPTPEPTTEPTPDDPATEDPATDEPEPTPGPTIAEPEPTQTLEPATENPDLGNNSDVDTDDGNISDVDVDVDGSTSLDNTNSGTNADIQILGTITDQDTPDEQSKANEESKESAEEKGTRMPVLVVGTLGTGFMVLFVAAFYVSYKRLDKKQHERESSSIESFDVHISPEHRLSLTSERLSEVEL